MKNLLVEVVLIPMMKAFSFELGTVGSVNRPCPF